MARICMIAYTFYSRDPRVRREAEALAGRGDSVDFICLKEAGKTGRETMTASTCTRSRRGDIKATARWRTWLNMRASFCGLCPGEFPVLQEAL